MTSRLLLCLGVLLGDLVFPWRTFLINWSRARREVAMIFYLHLLPPRSVCFWFLSWLTIGWAPQVNQSLTFYWLLSITTVYFFSLLNIYDWLRQLPSGPPRRWSCIRERCSWGILINWLMIPGTINCSQNQEMDRSDYDALPAIYITEKGYFN